MSYTERAVSYTHLDVYKRQVIDIEEQHVVVVAVQRQQGIEAVLQSAAIIQTGQGIEHTEIVERLSLIHIW